MTNRRKLMTKSTIMPPASGGNPPTPFNPALHEDLITKGYTYVRCKDFLNDQTATAWDEYVSPIGGEFQVIYVSPDGSSVTDTADLRRYWAK
jgi:hypothetical protein